MTTVVAARYEQFMAAVARQHPDDTALLQAVDEVAQTIIPYLADKPAYRDAHILERLTTPERFSSFCVRWQDETGKVWVNHGYNVLHDKALCAGSGGLLHFQHKVSFAAFKCLAFEQSFINGLAGLPASSVDVDMAGTDFDPEGKSEYDLAAFYQAFRLTLACHVGYEADVIDDDSGGSFSQGPNGKLNDVMPHAKARGYGLVYMLQAMLQHAGFELAGQRVCISGSGKMAQYAAKKLIQLGGKVLTLSDASGFIHDPDGIDAERLAHIQELKNEKHLSIGEYIKQYPKASFHKGQEPWSVPCDVALPCATYQAMSEQDARTLLLNGCYAVVEGAHRPIEPAGVDKFVADKTLYAPAKAASIGDLALAALTAREPNKALNWTAEDVDKRLQEAMTGIHSQCLEHGDDGCFTSYLDGANIAGFIELAEGTDKLTLQPNENHTLPS